MAGVSCSLSTSISFQISSKKDVHFMGYVRVKSYEVPVKFFLFFLPCVFQCDISHHHLYNGKILALVKLNVNSGAKLTANLARMKLSTVDISNSSSESRGMTKAFKNIPNLLAFKMMGHFLSPSHFTTWVSSPKI